jgi:hypothetical protein
VAKLPTRESLGALPNARAGQPIATLNPQLPGSSVAALTGAANAQSSAFSSLGEGIGSIGKAADAFYQKDLQQKAYETELRFQEFSWGQRQAIEERQRNAPVGGEGFTDTWSKDDFAARSEFMKSVPAQFKPQYEAKLFEDERKLTDAARQFQFGEQRRAAGIQLDDTLNGVHAPRARVAQTEELAKVTADYERLVDLDTRLSTQEKEEAKRKGRESIALSHIEGRPPEERIAILDAMGAGSLKAKLSWRESKNRPNAQNNLGYSGLWQFGAPRLATLGVYTPAADENVSDRSARGGWSGKKWGGEFNIPGFPEVKTVRDFLQNPKAQEVAYDLHAQRMDQEIAQNGFDQYIGQKVGGVEITREGLHGMLHLGGVGGTRNALEKGQFAKDDNKTSVLDYARMGTDGTGTALDYLPRDKVKALRANAQTELTAERVQQNNDTVVAQKERKRVSDEAEAGWLQKILTPGQTVTALEIAKDANLEVNAREQMINFLERAGKMDKTSSTYGKDFYSLFRRVHAADGDPERLTDPKDLYQHVSDGGGLTLSGMEKLRNEMSGRRTPEGAAEAELRKQFYANAKGQISGSNEGLGLRDPKGEELFLKFMAQTQADYDAGRKAGKSPSALLNPDSPDYIGKSISTYKRPMGQWFSDQVVDKPADKPAFDPRVINSLDDLKKAHASGFVNALEARAIAIQRGWARDRAPVAAPSGLPTVPVGR